MPVKRHETSRAIYSQQWTKQHIAAAAAAFFAQDVTAHWKMSFLVPCFICTLYSFTLLSMNCNWWRSKVQNEILEIPKFSLISSDITYTL